MTMSTWVIVSWVFVAILTGINIFVFLKLKGATEQMMKMAFPNAKNMGDAMAQAQKMMAGFGGMGAGMGGAPGAGTPRMGNLAGSFGGKNSSTGVKANDAQLKAAMDMLSKMQKDAKK